MRVSATANEAAAATATPPVPSADAPAAMTYADVNGLSFRALQRECKALGLSAIGTTAAMRGRLLGHFGLGRGEVDVVAPVMTATEIEVSRSLALLRTRSACVRGASSDASWLILMRTDWNSLGPIANYPHLTYHYRIVAFFSPRLSVVLSPRRQNETNTNES
jgi:hypothetical protein